MLQSLVLWLSCLALWARASILSSEGQLLIFADPARRQQPESSSKTPISPEAARLIIASRLGIEGYHDLSSGSDADYDAINAYAGQSTFEDTIDHRPVALVVLEEIAFTDAVPAHAKLDITSMPNNKATDSLLSDLVTQLADKDSMDTDASVNPSQMLHEGAIFRSNSASIRKIATSSHTNIYDLISTLQKTDQDILVLLTPRFNTLSSSSYGTWTVPKRATHSKRADKEEPLEPPHRSSTSSTNPTSPTKTPAYDQSKPLRGILPSCHSSRTACETATRNCTGHGTCSLAYTNKDVNTQGGKQCWSCACRARVRTNPDGTVKTTRYGGPACQKKDVVVPFWLLAGFSVVLVSLVSWAVGNLYSMGELDLPSVIGAGVSGPPKR